MYDFGAQTWAGWLQQVLGSEKTEITRPLLRHAIQYWGTADSERSEFGQQGLQDPLFKHYSSVRTPGRFWQKAQDHALIRGHLIGLAPAEGFADA